jgi:ATP-dependent helicase HepA
VVFPLGLGCKVRVVGNEAVGFGEVAGDPDDSGRVPVRFYVGPDSHEQRSLPGESLSWEQLPTETRCYYRDAETSALRCGRVLTAVDSPPGQVRQYHVRFPNQLVELLGEDAFRVRSYLGAADPVEVLAARAQETPHFFEQRTAWGRELLRQKAGCAGLTGLAAAKIELLPHQVEEAARLLQETRLRRLLADDASLGKTVVAGAVIRQLLGQDPELRLRVFAPAARCPQWRETLAGRFDMHDLEVWPHEALGLAGAEGPLEVLVIDRAERVVAPLARGSLAEAVRRLAASTPHLLLLADLPQLQTNPALPGLLGLLDAQEGLGDAEAAQARLSSLLRDRAPLALAAAGLSGDDPKPAAAQVAEQLPDDARALELAAQVAGGDRARAEELLGHLGETYRLHLGLLRTRRAWLLEQGDLGSWREEPQLELPLDDESYERAQKAWELLEIWRVEVAPRAKADEERALVLARRYVGLAGRLDADPAGFAGLIADALAEATSDTERAALAALRDLMGAAGLGERGRLLGEVLRHRHAKTPGSRAVVACQDAQVVAALLAPLEDALLEVEGAGVLFAHTGMSPEERDMNLAGFLSSESGAPFLVADDATLGDLRLPGVQGLIHFDLPWSLRALENRYAALDAVVRAQHIGGRLLLTCEEDGALDLAWYSLLEELGLFRESFDDLGGFLAEEDDRLARLALQGGPQALAEAGPAARARLEAARTEAAGDEWLDGLLADGGPVWRSLDGAEAAAEELGTTLTSYLRENLRLLRRRAGQHPDVFRFETETVKVGKGRTRSEQSMDPLVPRERLGMVGGYLGLSATVNRFRASRELDLQLLRAGHPFVEGLWDVAGWDDRGRAFAMWRHLPGATTSRLVFRIAVRVDHAAALDRAAATEELDAVARGALARRLGRWFPARWEEAFVDVSGKRIPEEAAELCRRPYERGAGDRNLSAERSQHLVEAEGLTAERWPELVREVTEAGQGLTLAGPDVVAALEAARAACTRECEAALQRLEARESQYPDEGARIDEVRLRATEERDLLLDVLGAPSALVETVGVYLLSGECPVVEEPVADDGGDPDL